MNEETIKLFPEKDRIDRLRLIRSANVGPVTFHRLIARFGTAGAALDALPEICRRAGGKAPKLASEADAVRELSAHAKAGAELIFHGEGPYPPLLAATEDAPVLLSVLGDVALLRKRAIAVVGARNASANGQRLAETLARDLGRAGLLVVSGLALGIDAAAHRGALETGTLGVLGGGVDVIYPRQNRELYDAMRQNGALISEVAPGETPTARHFPRRNRIISGMVRGVVVVEASLRSGSLITARLAGEQGRDVFAVPGAPQDPRGRGTNRLLRDGAILTETADDVFDAWSGGWQSGARGPCARAARQPAAASPPPPAATPAQPQPQAQPEPQPQPRDTQRDVLSALSTAPTSIDDVVRMTGVRSETVQMVFTELELGGRIERHPGGRVSLRAAL
jgi:DNA processing protein